MQNLQDLHGIRLPVGCAVQVGTWAQALDQLGDEIGLNQAAFVVPLFVPGIGKEDVHAVQRAGLQHVRHDFHGVVLNDADVGNLLLANALQKRAHAG